MKMKMDEKSLMAFSLKKDKKIVALETIKWVESLN
jgi:hypothetical protein